MKIDFSMKNEWVVVLIDGRVDSFTYPLMESDIQILLRTGAKKVVLDLSKNTHMNLGGYRLFQQTHEYLQSVNGELVILAPSKDFLKHLNYFISEEEIKIGQTLNEICG